MKKLFFLVLTLFLTYTGYCQNVENIELSLEFDSCETVQDSNTLARDSDPRVLVSGTIRNKFTGEVLPNVTVVVKSGGTFVGGTVTNSSGFFAILLLPGIYTFEVTYMGFFKQTYIVSVPVEGKPLAWELKPID